MEERYYFAFTFFRLRCGVVCGRWRCSEFFFIAAFLDMLAAFVYSNNNPFLLSSKRGFVCRLFLFLLLVRSLFLVTIFSRHFKPFFVPFSHIFFPTTFSKYFFTSRLVCGALVRFLLCVRKESRGRGGVFYVGLPFEFIVQKVGRLAAA